MSSLNDLQGGYNRLGGILLENFDTFLLKHGQLKANSYIEIFASPIKTAPLICVTRFEYQNRSWGFDIPDSKMCFKPYIKEEDYPLQSLPYLFCCDRTRYKSDVLLRGNLSNIFKIGEINLSGRPTRNFTVNIKGPRSYLPVKIQLDPNSRWGWDYIPIFTWYFRTLNRYRITGIMSEFGDHDIGTITVGKESIEVDITRPDIDSSTKAILLAAAANIFEIYHAPISRRFPNSWKVGKDGIREIFVVCWSIFFFLLLTLWFVGVCYFYSLFSDNNTLN